ncbi:hypothetical protein LPJ81_006525, partial [Coemansia sp. IMI 209127]
MTSIRISPVSTAAASAVDAAGRASSSASSCSSATLNSACIAIPNQREAKVSRRVSFNLGENSVRQLPSNSAISKITQARSHKLSSGISPPAPSNNGGSYSLSDDCLTCCEDFEEQARVAERRAKSMLPQGASHELLDPRFAMTALYVKNGHIRAIEPSLLSSDYGADEHSDDHVEQPLSSAPTRGVLKPFAPSPIDASFFGGSDDILDELTDEEDEEAGSVELSQLLRPPQAHRRSVAASSKRGANKGGSKRKSVRSKTDRPLASKHPDNANAEF